MDIMPGKTVSVEVTETPRNAAARKTLARLFRKDPHVARQQRWQSRHRPSWQEHRRGGRMWHHQMKSRAPVSLNAGSSYSILATLDVIRDLASVARWVKVAER